MIANGILKNTFSKGLLSRLERHSLIQHHRLLSYNLTRPSTLKHRLQSIPTSQLQPATTYIRNMSASTDFPPTEIREILNRITTLLKERNESISIAETAAGGLISSSILSTPGASGVRNNTSILSTHNTR